VRVDGIPFEQGNVHGSLHPIAVVLHRTYGGWPGSKGVAFGSEGLGFHFLIGKQEGRVVQLADTTQKCWHAKGGNAWSLGIEFEGVNEDPLTDWQIATAGRIVLPVVRAHGIPLDYMAPSAGRKAPSPGIRNHRNVPGSDHDDFVSPDDWQRIVGAMSAEEDDMFTDQDRQILEDLRARISAVEQRFPRVESGRGVLFTNGTWHRGFTTAEGHLQRWVWRRPGELSEGHPGGWVCDVDEPGFVPGEEAMMCSDPRGETQFGVNFEISARLANGKAGRVTWVPKRGFSDVEEIG